MFVSKIPDRCGNFTCYIRYYLVQINNPHVSKSLAVLTYFGCQALARGPKEVLCEATSIACPTYSFRVNNSAHERSSGPTSKNNIRSLPN